MSSNQHPNPDPNRASPNNQTPLSPAQAADLQQRAIAVAHHAYAPYSHFHVGAAVLLWDGAIVTACNVENASYRLTVFAEQAANAAPARLRVPQLPFRATALPNPNDPASPPCGARRPTIREFSTPDTTVFFPGEKGAIAQSTIAGLLPAAFLLTNS